MMRNNNVFLVVIFLWGLEAYALVNRRLQVPTVRHTTSQSLFIQSSYIALSQLNRRSSSHDVKVKEKHTLLTSNNATLSDTSDDIHIPTPPSLYSVDVRYNRRSPLIYDSSSGRYLDATEQTELSSVERIHHNTHTRQGDFTIFQRLGQFLHAAFVPEGVTDSYYRFMKWRILQRFVNANVHVIGTQSLLMGLRGMQRGATGSAPLAAAAATNWVLKDTLGKVVRMAWASKMGRKVRDSDCYLHCIELFQV